VIPVLTAEDVRRQDAAAEERGISVDTLMRAAGAAVAQSAGVMLGGAYGKRVVVVCGKGNNAGDGLVAARVLARRGALVTVVLAAGEPKGGAAARALRAFDGRVLGPDALESSLESADLVVDALLGVGVTRAPEGDVGVAVRTVAACGCPVLAVDVPSGLDADTGDVPGDAVRAWHTVTFTGFKPGLLFSRGAGLAGLIEVADIGIPRDVLDGTAFSLEESDVRALLPERNTDANKYRSGVAMVVAGSRAMPGAAALACGAAVGGGAGLVMLAAPASVCSIVVALVPEVVTVPLDDGPEGVLDEKGLDAIRDRLAKANAIAIGPGLSRHHATEEAVRRLVATTDLPLVLDADGLNAFEGRLADLGTTLHRAVLTPHPGEFQRLTGFPAEDRLSSARTLAQRTGATALLKGYGTVVASGDGRLAVNATGGADLASAGTGDVLTGLIAALLARGLGGFEAAAAGAFVHGTTADVLAPRLPSASDLVERLPAVLGSLR
jgi:NAD(P)H-hydrate epimerase